MSDWVTAVDACRQTGITYRQLNYWDKIGLVHPSINQARGSGSRRVYSHRDLAQLRLCRQLVDVGVTLQRIRYALAAIREADQAGQHARYLIIHTDSVAVAADLPALAENLNVGFPVVVVPLNHRRSEEDVAS